MDISFLMQICGIITTPIKRPSSFDQSSGVWKGNCVSIFPENKQMSKTLPQILKVRKLKKYFLLSPRETNYFC